MPESLTQHHRNNNETDMGGWISLLLWLAVAALLLGGWFYNMGQYREATKEVLVVVGSCAASMWLLARFNPGLWPPLAAGAVAVGAALALLFTPLGRAVPRYAAMGASVVGTLGLLYVLDTFTPLPDAAAYAVGAALFLALYAATIYIYARRAARRD